MRWLVLLVALSGCAQAPPACVAAGATPGTVAQMFFGRSVTGREPVTDAEWAAFAQGVITPRLPDGFTVLDGSGQWLNPKTGTIGRETTKILLVALPGKPGDSAALHDIGEAWKQQFHQQSVGLILTRGCAAF